LLAFLLFNACCFIGLKWKKFLLLGLGKLSTCTICCSTLRAIYGIPLKSTSGTFFDHQTRPVVTILKDKSLTIFH
ncbi:hypothetical protein VIGAN_03144000, partial [Vigna angularis var. angularis]